MPDLSLADCDETDSDRPCLRAHIGMLQDMGDTGWMSDRDQV